MGYQYLSIFLVVLRYWVPPPPPPQCPLYASIPISLRGPQASFLKLYRKSNIQCFMTNQEKVQILDHRQTTCEVILSGFFVLPLLFRKERLIAGFNCHARPLTTANLCWVVLCVAPHGTSSKRETACSLTLENLCIKYALRSHVQAFFQSSKLISLS